jgi:hypothetical protein
VSVRAARRAGTTAAARATSNSPTAVVKKVTASTGCTSNSTLRSSRERERPRHHADDRERLAVEG